MEQTFAIKERTVQGFTVGQTVRLRDARDYVGDDPNGRHVIASFFISHGVVYAAFLPDASAPISMLTPEPDSAIM